MRNTIRKKLQKRLYAHLCQMQDEGKSLTLREQQFMEEYAALLGEKGKDAVIRRENKTKRRQEKKLSLTAARAASNIKSDR